MEVNAQIVKTASIQYGLPFQFAFKEFHVMNVLALIAKGDNSDIVFKGGTALNKAYLGTNWRFSEYLDFDFDCKNMQELVKRADLLSHSVEGYKVGDFRKVKSTIQFYLEYSLPDGKDHVRIDMALKPIMTLKTPSYAPLSSPLSGSVVSGIRVYSIDDLLARKLAALHDRHEGKDLFDIFHGLPLAENFRKAIKFMLKSEGKDIPTEDFIAETVQNLKKMNMDNVRNIANPFIPVSKRPRDWKMLRAEVEGRLRDLM